MLSPNVPPSPPLYHLFTHRDTSFVVPKRQHCQSAYPQYADGACRALLSVANVQMGHLQDTLACNNDHRFASSRHACRGRDTHPRRSGSTTLGTQQNDQEQVLGNRRVAHCPGIPCPWTLSHSSTEISTPSGSTPSGSTAIVSLHAPFSNFCYARSPAEPRCRIYRASLFFLINNFISTVSETSGI